MNEPRNPSKASKYLVVPMVVFMLMVAGMPVFVKETPGFVIQSGWMPAVLAGYLFVMFLAAVTFGYLLNKD